MKIAITGGTGTIGRFVIDFLAERNHELVASKRKPSDPEGFGPLSTQDRLHWFSGDLEDPTFANKFLHSCEALVHCGFAHLPGKYRGGEGDDPPRFWRQNFLSTVRLLDVARELGVRRVVLLSSRAVFDGYNSDLPLADDIAPSPTTHYGLLNVAKEHLARVYSDLEVFSIRPTGVYGLTQPPERSKWWGLVAKARSRCAETGFSMEGKTEVHGVDLAAAIHLLLTSPKKELTHTTYNCSDIVVSEHFVYAMARAIFTESLDSSDIEIPQASATKNHMATRALAALGWSAGGMRRLQSTLKTMVELQKS